MKFKLGDHVRVTNFDDVAFDKVGRITAIYKKHDKRFPLRVSGLHDWPICYAPDELILADPLNVMLNDVEGQRLVQAIHERKEKAL